MHKISGPYRGVWDANNRSWCKTSTLCHDTKTAACPGQDVDHASDCPAPMQALPYNATVAWLGLWSSCLAYEFNPSSKSLCNLPFDPEVAERYLNTYFTGGWRVVNMYNHTYNTFPLGYFTVRSTALDPNVAIVAFRGSQPSPSPLTVTQIIPEIMNATFDTAPPSLGYPNGTSILGYFLQAYMLLGDQVMADPIWDACPGCNVLFTGHSLGASLAAIALGHAGHLGRVTPDKVDLYTFGQARTGNPIFSASLANTRHFRVTMNRDPGIVIWSFRPCMYTPSAAVNPAWSPCPAIASLRVFIHRMKSGTHQGTTPLTVFLAAPSNAHCLIQ
eukprot:gene10469-1901_t